MRTSGFMLAACLAAAGVCGMGGAGEEYMPLVPGAFSPAEFGPDGESLRRISSADADAEETKRPVLRKNIIRLTMPAPEARPDAKMRMMEASPDGPGGALKFTPLASMPAARHVDIPGFVPPEVLAVSRMEQDRELSRRPQGFSPIRLPGALGTEELPEFDPYSVQRTGNPFKDAPGKAEAFPAAATRSQIREDRPPENNDMRPLRLPSAPEAARIAPGPEAAGSPSPLRPPPVSGASLRPPGVSTPLSPQGAPPVAAAKQQTGPAVAPVALPKTAAELSMPPLPELPAGGRSGMSGWARRAEVVTLPPPLPDRDREAALRQAGEFSLLSPSRQTEAPSGLVLALPPTALTGGEAMVVVTSLDPAKSEPIRPAPVMDPPLRPGERIIAPPAPQALQVSGSMPRPRQTAEARPSRVPAIEQTKTPAPRRGIPAPGAKDFTPMRGVRVY